jgi:hypothetical protein
MAKEKVLVCTNFYREQIQETLEVSKTTVVMKLGIK